MRVDLVGGADHIGASCALVETNGTRILVDCGIDVSSDLSPENRVWIPEVNVREKLADQDIDLLLITHGHNDHVGALLGVMKDHPDMRVMMTRPTLETTLIMLADGIRIGYKDASGNIVEGSKEAMFEELNEMKDMLTRVEIVESPGFFSPFRNVPIRIGCFAASHIRGAMTVLIQATENGKQKSVLFTGDFGLEDKKTVLAAPIPDVYQNLDLVLPDGTNGDTRLAPRQERLAKLVAVTHATLERGGNVLGPAFGNERSPEVTMSLNENGIRVFMDGMGNRFLDLYGSPEGRWCDQDRILDASDPVWRNFRKVELPYQNPGGHTREKILNSKNPWVVVATSASLNGGASPEYAMRILEDPKSTIIFTAHLFEGTPAHDLFHRPEEGITLVTRAYPEGKPVIPQCQVEQIRLSAHMDQSAIVRFIETIQPKQFAPVHCGGATSHDALAELLGKKFPAIRTQNGMTIEL